MHRVAFSVAECFIEIFRCQFWPTFASRRECSTSGNLSISRVQVMQTIANMIFRSFLLSTRAQRFAQSPLRLQNPVLKSSGQPASHLQRVRPHTKFADSGRRARTPKSSVPSRVGKILTFYNRPKFGVQSRSRSASS